MGEGVPFRGIPLICKSRIMTRFEIIVMYIHWFSLAAKTEPQWVRGGDGAKSK